MDGQRMTRAARVLTVVIVLVLLTAGGAVAASRRTFESVDSRDVANQVIHKGGVIRLGNDVYVHEDDKHTSVGITSIAVRDCTVVLGLDYTVGSKVISAVVDEDETVSRLDVQAGISGGNTEATIFLWRDGQQVCPRWSQFGSSGNLWVSITTLDAPDVAP